MVVSSISCCWDRLSCQPAQRVGQPAVAFLWVLGRIGFWQRERLGIPVFNAFTYPAPLKGDSRDSNKALWEMEMHTSYQRHCSFHFSLLFLPCFHSVFPNTPSIKLHSDMMPLTSMKVPQTSRAIPQSHSAAGTTVEQNLAIGLQANPLSNENLQLLLSLPLIGPLRGWNTILRFVNARRTSASEEL